MDIESKYIIKSNYNKFTEIIADDNIKRKILVDKSAIGGLINNADLEKKGATLAEINQKIKQ